MFGFFILFVILLVFSVLMSKPKCPKCKSEAVEISSNTYKCIHCEKQVILNNENGYAEWGGSRAGGMFFVFLLFFLILTGAGLVMFMHIGSLK